MSRRIVSKGLIGLWLLWLTLLICLALAVSVALYPSADNLTVFQDSGTTIDASHSDQGYIMVKHTASKSSLKMRIICGDSTNTYDLASDEQYETFPLTFGDGDYQVKVFRQVSGKRYTNDSSLSFTVTIADESFPFLYPNQYVAYTSQSAAVAHSIALCQSLTTPQECIEAVQSDVVNNIRYDYTLAATVQSDYLPVIDDVLSSGKGICFDYAALTACMLRVQGLPTKLVIGYADTLYHAWNSVLINGEWQLLDTTALANNMKVKRYTVERVY